MNRIVWYLLVGSRGAQTRTEILQILIQKPHNAHQLAKELSLDYKTVQHHLRMLAKHKVVETKEKGKYGATYMLSPFIPDLREHLEQLFAELGEKH